MKSSALLSCRTLTLDVLKSFTKIERLRKTRRRTLTLDVLKYDNWDKIDAGFNGRTLTLDVLK